MPNSEITQEFKDWIESNRKDIDALNLGPVYKSSKGDGELNFLLFNRLSRLGVNPFSGLIQLPEGFLNLSRISKIVIPDSITSIGKGAFSHCSSLTSVTIGNSVTSIGSYAFYNCSDLEIVIIPDSVTYIGWGVFYGCSKLKNITYTGPIEYWKAIAKGSSWKEKVPSTCLIHCTDGDINI